MILDYHLQINIYGQSLVKIVENNISLEYILKAAGIYEFLIIEVPQQTISSHQYQSVNPNRLYQPQYYGRKKEISFFKNSVDNLQSANENHLYDDAYDAPNWLCSTPVNLPDFGIDLPVIENGLGSGLSPTLPSVHENNSKLAENKAVCGTVDDIINTVEDNEMPDVSIFANCSLFNESDTSNRNKLSSHEQVSKCEQNDEWAEKSAGGTSLETIEERNSTLHYSADSESEMIALNNLSSLAVKPAEREMQGEKVVSTNGMEQKPSDAVNLSPNHCESLEEEGTDLNVSFQSCLSFEAPSARDNESSELFGEEFPSNAKKDTLTVNTPKKFLVHCKFPDCNVKLWYVSKRGTYNLSEHVRLHCNKLTRVCTVCGVSKRTIYALRVHHNQKHPELKFVRGQEQPEHQRELIEIAKICYPTRGFRIMNFQ
ncbi:unnamed protein product [Auanema sp. JU1783]|nr:unnamed protein product [Auanema sp. JU1783]